MITPWLIGLSKFHWKAKIRRSADSC